METTELIKKNFMDMLDMMYNHIKDIIINNGGFINLTKIDASDGDMIYSLEIVSNGDEVAQWEILGLKIKNDRVYYCADYIGSCGEMVTDEELNEYEWFDLKATDNYYLQTLYNIFESIEYFV